MTTDKAAAPVGRDCTCYGYEGRDCRRCFDPPYPDEAAPVGAVPQGGDDDFAGTLDQQAILAKIKGDDYGHHFLSSAATVIRQQQAALASQAARMGEWIAVGERLPKACVPVLVCVESGPSGRCRVLRAMYAAPNTLELGCDQEWWEGCTEDENETTYVPAGWYERNEYEETSWHVHDAVIAWQPLPAPPAAIDKLRGEAG